MLSKKITGLASDIDNATKKVLSKMKFEIKGASERVVDVQGISAPQVALLSIDAKKVNELEAARRAGAKLSNISRRAKVSSVALLADGISENILSAFLEGVILADYRFSIYKEDKTQKLKKVHILGQGVSATKKAIKKAVSMSSGGILARNIANLPGNDGLPKSIVKFVRKKFKGTDIKISVLNKKALEAKKMNAFLAVSKGSPAEPQLLILEYSSRKSDSRPPIVMIGKGITFDTGGVSLKPSDGMSDMKLDKGGAAAVIGAMKIIAEEKPSRRVVALVALAENAIDGNATRPGDIVSAMNGQTIEILNTDAEGRLLLADTLSYAKIYKPEVIIDVATLTGACVVALGFNACGMFSNDKTLTKGLSLAGEKTFERVWEMPLWDEYAQEMKGDVSDIRNIAKARWGGACTAAGFLTHFVPDGVKWAHLDIAGPGMLSADTAYTKRGGSGFGARLLAQWIANLE